MLDIGWSELLLIGVVALIVIGPEDLPKLFHTLGRFTARARSMAREFSSAMEDAAKASGLDDAKKSMDDLRSVTSKKALGLDALDRAATKFEQWDPTMPPRQTAPIPDPDAAKPAPAAAAPAASEPALAAPPAAAPPAAMKTAAEPGKRRIAGVRRSDTKDS